MSSQRYVQASTRTRPLLILHTLATVGVFGADLVLLMLGFSAVFGADPHTIYCAAHLIASNVVPPLALASVLTGVLLAQLTGWGLFRYWWVTLKLAITLVLTLLVLTVLVPRLGAAAADPSFTTAERLPLAVAPALATVFLIVNVALAVYKPGWRVRRGRPQVAATAVADVRGAR